jgi:hypothetical protein
MPKKQEKKAWDKVLCKKCRLYVRPELIEESGMCSYCDKESTVTIDPPETVLCAYCKFPLGIHEDLNGLGLCLLCRMG